MESDLENDGVWTDALDARHAKRLESLPAPILDEVMARLVPIFE